MWLSEVFSLSETLSFNQGRCFLESPEFIRGEYVKESDFDETDALEGEEV